ncbi:MAG: LytR/AlgR family response regulator transcription factor [Clostridiales bacterium]
MILLEDDSATRALIKKSLYEIPEITDIFDTGNGNQAIMFCKTIQPDLVILDVEFEHDELNALEVSRIIYSLNNRIQFIFISTNSQLKSFAVYSFSYILKPIIINEFKSMVIEIAGKINQQRIKGDNILIIKSGKERVFIHKDDIFYVEAKNNKCIIHTKSEIWTVYKPLKEIMDELNSSFIKVHRSYIVNVNKIKRLREIWDRTYEVEFFDYPLKAQMSRNEYRKYMRRVYSEFCVKSK